MSGHIGVIMVDDEVNVLRSMKHNIPWTNLGYSLVGTASDGQSAMDMIKKKNPHVVVTDIVMPKMNGLELIRQISSFKKKPVIVIMSAYNEFEYAREAIYLGARAYILKPFDYEEFKKVFSEIREELSHSNTISGGISSNESSIDELKIPKYIYKAKNFIDNNLEKKITLKSVAEAIYINKSYLSVIFKKEIGISFTDYVTKQRIEKSKIMLRESSLKIMHIAVQVGYDDYSYYTRVFKKIEGITPMEYRVQYLLGKIT